MLDIKTILKNNGIEGEVVDTIADTIKAEIPKKFVSKEQYAKKVNAIDELNNTIADLEAKSGTDEYKTKYESLQTEYNDFKTNIETEKINNSKTDKLRSQLKAEGLNDKLVNLMLKEFDLDKIELEEDNIKGWEEISKPVKENYAEFFKVEQTVEGNAPTTPPQKLSTENKDPFLMGFDLK